MTKPVGPYTPIVRAGDLLISSGQIGIADGAIVEGGFGAQARQALDNLQALIEGAGASLDDVVKTVVFLTDMGEYAEMNDIYLEYFDSNRPARSAVAVAALPLGALFEIEATVYKPE